MSKKKDEKTGDVKTDGVDSGPGEYEEEDSFSTNEIAGESSDNLGPVSRLVFLEDDIFDTPLSESVPETVRKAKRARSGKVEAQNDVRNIPERLQVAFRRGSNGWADVVDTSLFFLIAVVTSVSLLGSLVFPLPDIAQSIIYNPTELGDLSLLTSLLFVSAAIGVTVNRMDVDNRLPQFVSKFSRVSLLILQIIPIILTALLFAAISGGYSRYSEVIQVWVQFKNPILRSLPQPIIDVMVSYNTVGPTGFTVQHGLIIIGLFGLAFSAPVTYRTVKRFFATASVEPVEFWETVDYRTDWSVKDRSRMAELLNAEEEEDEQKREVGNKTEPLGVGDRKTVDEKIRNLLTLPDEMKESPYENYEEVERYWVNAPYAYVSIVYDSLTSDYRYVVVEPPMDEVETAMRNEITEQITPELLHEGVEGDEHEEINREKVQILEEKAIEISEEYNFNPSDETFHKVLYYIERDFVGYENIDPIMKDSNVEDISCNGDDRYVFVFHREYSDLESNVKFSEEELETFVRTLARRAGEQVSTADPNVGVSLPDGSRAELSLGKEVTPEGSSFTIRLFRDIPFTPIDLIEYGTFDIDQMAYLWFAIEHNQSLIFAGGTASGKTTSMNAISLFIPPKQKVVSIEDTKEISLPRENWLATTTRDGLGSGTAGSEIGMYDLLRSALRLRPEYMIVGEIRGEEAETLFQAMSTGHTTYSTMHANSAERAIGRLTNPPIDVPQHMVRSLDILCIQSQVRFTDENGEKKNVRRNKEIREIEGVADTTDDTASAFDTSVPYEWDSERDVFIESLDNSTVLEEIAEQNGYSSEEILDELEERQMVLQYLIDNDVTDFELVSQTIQAYMIDSESVIQQIQDDKLEPQMLRDVTEVTWSSPDSREEAEMLLSRVPDPETETVVGKTGDAVSGNVLQQQSSADMYTTDETQTTNTGHHNQAQSQSDGVPEATLLDSDTTTETTDGDDSHGGEEE